MGVQASATDVVPADNVFGQEGMIVAFGALEASGR